MKKEKRYCNIDHANTQTDRLRKNANRASKQRAAQRETTAPAEPAGAADSAAKTNRSG